MASWRITPRDRYGPAGSKQAQHRVALRTTSKDEHMDPGFKAKGNEVLLPDGRQMLVVLPSSCTRKQAAEIARMVAQWLNERTNDRDLAT